MMSYPLSSGKDGIKIQPDKMEPETLYHCILSKQNHASLQRSQ